MNYFADVRFGYEGVYDIVTDRFGNHTTGFSGIGTRNCNFGTGQGTLVSHC